MSDRTADPGRARAHTAAAAAIPTRLLVAGGPFTGRVGTDGALAAIARGVLAAGLPEADVLVVAHVPVDGVREALDGLDLQPRLRACRAVIVAAEGLDPATLPGSPAFEIATAARQAGVPAYAVAAASTLGPFEERMLDLQVVVRAASARALRTAGAELARLAFGLPAAAPAPASAARIRSGTRNTNR